MPTPVPTYRKFSWRPDVPDHRDYYFSAIPNLSIPKFVNRIGMEYPLDDQGNLGSCTGNAATAAIEIVAHTPELSRLMAYYLGRQLEGTTNSDSGAMIRDVVKGISRYGVCAESLWPYNISKFRYKPTASAYANAATLRPKIASYNRIVDLAGVKSSLAMGIPVIFGFAVPDYFVGRQVETTGWVRLPTRNDVMIGGHAVVAVGFDDRPSSKFIWARNSWGTNWGLGGYFKMDQAWFTDPRRIVDDMWAIIPR